MRKQTVIRRIALGASQAFALFTFLHLIINKNYENLPISLITFVLLFAPNIIEKLLRLKMSAAAYVFSLFYALGPLLGDYYKLYHYTVWWDKLLHTCGGVVFALLGIYIFRRLAGERSRVIARAAFALCFSVSLAAGWEFIEFGCDRWLGTDMQRDTVVTRIVSYDFGESVGTTGEINDIRSVLVDGRPLPVNGYLDVGLTDSMTDMLLESLGALALCGAYMTKKGQKIENVLRPADKKI